MNDEERLEDIKRLWDEKNDPCEPDDYEWLIEQAEREMKNRDKIMNLHVFLQDNIKANKARYWGEDVISVAKKEILKLQKENKKLRDTLGNVKDEIEFNGSKDYFQMKHIMPIIYKALEYTE